MSYSVYSSDVIVESEWYVYKIYQQNVCNNVMETSLKRSDERDRLSLKTSHFDVSKHIKLNSAI